MCVAPEYSNLATSAVTISKDADLFLLKHLVYIIYTYECSLDEEL